MAGGREGAEAGRGGFLCNRCDVGREGGAAYTERPPPNMHLHFSYLASFSLSFLTHLPLFSPIKRILLPQTTFGFTRYSTVIRPVEYIRIFRKSLVRTVPLVCGNEISPGHSATETHFANGYIWLLKLLSTRHQVVFLCTKQTSPIVDWRQ